MGRATIKFGPYILTADDQLAELAGFKPASGVWAPQRDYTERRLAEAIELNSAISPLTHMGREDADAILLTMIKLGEEAARASRDHERKLEELAAEQKVQETRLRAASLEASLIATGEAMRATAIEVQTKRLEAVQIELEVVKVHREICEFTAVAKSLSGKEPS